MSNALPETPMTLAWLDQKALGPLFYPTGSQELILAKLVLTHGVNLTGPDDSKPGVADWTWTLRMSVVPVRPAATHRRCPFRASGMVDVASGPT